MSSHLAQPLNPLKRLYLVTVSSDHLVWSSSAAEAEDFVLSLPLDQVDPKDWYGTTKLSRHEPAAGTTYDPNNLETQPAYDVAGMFDYVPVLVTDDADIDLDLTVARAIELDRLAHALSCAA